MTKTKTGQVKRAMRDHPLAVVIVMSALGFPLALLVNWLMNSVAMLAVLFVLGCVAAVLLEQYRPHAQKPMEVSMMAARALGVLLAGFAIGAPIAVLFHFIDSKLMFTLSFFACWIYVAHQYLY